MKLTLDKRLIAIITILVIGVIVLLKNTRPKTNFTEIQPTYTHFIKKISATGLVTPKNRIVLTAPINGRIDEVLVDDGQVVKKNQVLAWMSSQDRAALMDAAQVSKEANNAELTQMYKPTPIVAPESGTIISKKIAKGQNVGLESVLFEISDKLVFVAKVDETDLGKIAIDQKVRVRVDAFPGTVIEAKVEHIVHQSSLNNNITTYDVFVSPIEKMPSNLRSGMSISVDFILLEKEKALVIPAYISEGQQNTSISVNVKNQNKVSSRMIKLGENNGEFSEVISGVNENDVILFADLSLLSNENSKSGLNLFGKKK